MSQFKLPAHNSTGNLAQAAAQARALAQGVQRQSARQAKDAEKSGEAKAGEQAQAKGPAGSSPTASKGEPKAPPAPLARPGAGARPLTTQKAPTQQGGKAQQAKGGAKATDEAELSKLKAHEAAELDSHSGDSFQADSSITDMRRFWGEEGTGSHVAVKDLDLFDPNLSPAEVEQLGSLRGAVHVARLLQHWGNSGMDQGQATHDAAQMLLAFARPEQARGVMRELERAPITHVYPMQIQLQIMEEHPEFWPNVSRGPVVENKDALAQGDRVMAGHNFRVHVPTTMKLKAFALLGPEKPGYEFEPVRSGVYRMLVDTPGSYTFAVRGEVAGKQLLDTFQVTVHQPGSLPEPTEEL
ncbi:MAG: hypothetical protein HY904_24285 [Deltaproteobacteria bacterium]|nr:hypothetical protein [Deltaproteobacteria bacterium]